MNWDRYLEIVGTWEKVCVDPKGFNSLEFDTPVVPKDYLSFAEKDLELNNSHGHVNSLSNAKRAIDCQITNILSVLGLPKSGNIHKKIERIKGIEVLAPRILKKLNKIRNLLEHEFTKPTLDEAEDAVDIATLFLAATEKVFINFMNSFWVAKNGTENSFNYSNEEIDIDDLTNRITFSDGMYFQFDHSSKSYSVWCYLNDKEVFYADVELGSCLLYTSDAADE